MSLFSHHRYPEQLAKLLAQSKSAEHARKAYVFPEENDWAASSFLVELLLHAKPLRAPLDHARTHELLSTAAAPVTVAHLEERGFIRFVLGRLQIPEAVLEELRFEKHRDELPDIEREALKRLNEARRDETAPLWIAKAEAERIHMAHARAHRRTPSLEALCGSHVLAPADREGIDGYGLLLNGRGHNSLWTSYLGSRALGLYWEELTRDEAFGSDDDARFSRWLDVALELSWWVQAPEWMQTSEDRNKRFRDRLLDAAQRRILAETDIIDARREIERIRWDHHGFGFRGAPDLPIPPGSDEGLLLLYKWWTHGHFGHTRNRCREDLNALIALVVFYEQDPWKLRTIELLKASRERPYLMHAMTTSFLLSGREAIAGLVANLETASVGIQLIAALTMRENPPVQDWEARWDDEERRKSKIWREAVSLLLGTLHEEVKENNAVEEAARALAEALVISARCTVQATHRPDEDEFRRRGAKARLDVLLDELRGTGNHLLWVLAPVLPQHLAEQATVRHPARPNIASMPVAPIRILLWLLRTTIAAGEVASLDPMMVAETLLSLYCGELRRTKTPDGSEVVSWSDDVPEALLLPWVNLAVFLHQQGLAHRLIGPEDLDFDREVRRVQAENPKASDSEQSDSAIHTLYRAWIRKTRLHVRILICIHETVQELGFDPVLSLTSHQRSALLDLVEERLLTIVQKHAAGDRDSERPSLFEPDDNTYADGLRSSTGLLVSLVKSFNRFSNERRDKAFADWIAIENNPIVLLTIINEALSHDAKQRASQRFGCLNIENFLGEQLWFTPTEQVAEAAASLREYTGTVEQVLEYGDREVGSSYRESWDQFAYRMRLMIAYHNRSLVELERVPAPAGAEEQHYTNHTRRDLLEDTRSFYRALLLIENQPEQAWRIFDDLLQRHPGSASHALNRSLAALEAAKKVDDPEKRRCAFMQALHSWQEVEPSIPRAALAYLQDSIIYLRLASFDGAERHEEFDTGWSQLNAAQRAQIDLIALAVDNAHRRGLQDRVTEILAHARPYHVDQNGDPAARFAQILQDSAAGKPVADAAIAVVDKPSDNVEAMQFSYLRLRNAPPEVVAQAVGGKDTELHEFIWGNLQAAALEFLNRIALFAGFKEENKYNDIFVSFLQMRLDLLGWQVADQTRQGRSLSGNNVGELDWTLRVNSRKRAIFEAMRLYSVATKYIDDHIQKALFNYNPSGVRLIFIVVYYEGDRSWPHFWDDYLEHVRSKQWPGLLPVPVPDAKQLSVEDTNLRMARLVYERDRVPIHVYHVAMNMNAS